jgi:hypothetical protein
MANANRAGRRDMVFLIFVNLLERSDYFPHDIVRKQTILSEISVSGLLAPVTAAAMG